MAANWKSSNRQAEIEFSRRRKAFFKRILWKRYIGIRLLCILLLFSTLSYLAAMACLKDRMFSVKEDYTISFKTVDDKDREGLVTDLYGVIVRLRKGELEFYHGRESIENISR